MTTTVTYGNAGPAHDAPRLACGCVRGYFLCLEAVRLWDAANRAYYAGEYDEYETWRAAYDAHFEEM